MDELAEDATSWWSQFVVLSTDGQNDWRTQEKDGWQKEGQPKADILLSIDHADLTDKRTAVDAEIEVQEHTGVGDGRIHNDTLSSLLQCHNTNSGVLVLLGEEGRNVGLEEAGADTERDEANDECGQGRSWLDNDRRSSTCGQDDMGNDRHHNGDVNGLETTEVGVSDVGTEERHHVCPKLVEESETGGYTLALSKSTGLT